MATNDDQWAMPHDMPVDMYANRLTRGARPTKRINAFSHLFTAPTARPVKARKPMPQRNRLAPVTPTRCACPPVKTRHARPVRTQVETLGDYIELGDLGKTPKKLSKTALRALPPQFRAAWESKPTSTPGWTNAQPETVPQVVTPLTNNAAAPVAVVDSYTNAQPFLPAQTASVSKFEAITDLIGRGLDTVREANGMQPNGNYPAPAYTTPATSAPLVSAGINTPAGSIGGNVGIGFNSDGSLSLGGGGSISPMLLLGGAAIVFLLLKKK